PGAPDGYATLAKFAALDLARLVAPAVRAAHDGMAWTRVGLSYVHEALGLLRQHNVATIYLPDGKVPAEGSPICLPGLGALLERFARLGAELFARDDGQRLVDAVQSRGGFISRDDLRLRIARIVEPQVAQFDGVRLIATPDPTGGARLIPIIAE